MSEALPGLRILDVWTITEDNDEHGRYLGTHTENHQIVIMPDTENYIDAFDPVSDGFKTLAVIPAEAVPALKAYLASHADFYRACKGEDGAEPTPLQWLRAVVTDFRDLRQKTTHLDEDPQATAEALHEADNLLDALEAACTKAEGRVP